MIASAESGTSGTGVAPPSASLHRAMVVGICTGLHIPDHGELGSHEPRSSTLAVLPVPYRRLSVRHNVPVRRLAAPLRRRCEVGERCRSVPTGASLALLLFGPVGECGQLGYIRRPVEAIGDVGVLRLPARRSVVLLAHDVCVTRVAAEVIDHVKDDPL